MTFTCVSRLDLLEMRLSDDGFDFFLKEIKKPHQQRCGPYKKCFWGFFDFADMSD